MSRLLYNSATDIKVSRDDMRGLVTPEPMGSRHAPYPFVDFADNTVTAIERAGFKIEGEEYAVTKDFNRMFGLLNVSKESAPIAPSYSLGVTAGLPAIYESPWSLLVGLRGAHDQRISRGLAIGSQVMVCSNLCFHGDLGDWKSKQTTNIAQRIPEMVADAVTGLGRAGRKLTVDFDGFNRAQISRGGGDDILLSIFRSGGFSASQLGRAVEDWDNCSIEEHTTNGRNLWWLFNSATQALKPTGANSNPNDLQHRSTIVYSKILPAATQLLAA